jgi:glycosyltransferase involved in cell wall biosynthesis
MESIEISLVVPMYNEADCVAEFFEHVIPVLERITSRYEIVCVNDGSRDDTLSRLLAMQEQNPSVVIVDLARNFGKEAALSAGLDYARGAAVVPIDADLQDPPELIEEFVARWREGFDVVYAQRRTRQGESFLKLRSAEMFYTVLNRLSEVWSPPNTGDYRLMDRKVVEALRQLPERTRFMKGMFAWVGFRQVAVEFDRDPRVQGTTKWNYGKLWRFAIDGITSFSARPLKVWTYLGLFVAAFAFVYAAFLVGRTLIMGVDVPGYASLIVVVLFLGGLQMVGIGILGEYIGRIFSEVKQRPVYLVRQCHRVDTLTRALRVGSTDDS